MSGVAACHIARGQPTARFFVWGASMHRLLSALLAAACFMATSETALTSPVGLWLAKDGAKIRISPCGRNLCGFIVQSSPQIDPATVRPPTDKNNADLAKR